MSGALYRTAALAVTAALVAVGTASAAPGNGATITKLGDCYSYGGYTTCFDYRYVSNSTATPSGNLHYVTNGDSASTTTGPGGYEYSYTDKFHSTYLILKGETQVSHYSDRYATSYAGVTCTYRFKYHYANGELRISVSDYSCAPTG
jgi:hypothetical protein